MISRADTDQRQLELAAAALQIIATRGITALTTRVLAEQMGLTSGAIFRHFASLDAVVRRVETVLDSTFPSDDTSGALERLERFIDARTTAAGERVGILRLVLSEQFQLCRSRARSDWHAVSRRRGPSWSARCEEHKTRARCAQTSRPRGWVAGCSLPTPSPRSHESPDDAPTRPASSRPPTGRRRRAPPMKTGRSMRGRGSRTPPTGSTSSRGWHPSTARASRC